MAPSSADPIVIADYDPHWPSLYQEEKERILSAIGPSTVDIQHIGSTAVPGLAAKPIIDIMPGIRRLADARACIGPLAALGYDYVPEYEADMPYRRYFRKGQPRTHHIHMVEPGTEFWQRHLLFRDYLREHPDVARQYDQLKRELAARFGSDTDGYTEAKTKFIHSVEARARAQRREHQGARP